MWILKKLTAAIMAATLMVSMATAGDDLGPPIGAKIPSDLAAVDSTGAPQDFSSLVGEKGMVLYFVRSLDWCPYCRLQALEVAKRTGDFTDRDFSVVFVSYDAVEKLQKFDRKWEVSPTLLSDPDSKIIEAFGILNETHKPGSMAYGIPHPVVFIVAPDKTILAKVYEDDFKTNDASYRRRPEVDVVLAAADKVFSAGE